MGIVRRPSNKVVRCSSNVEQGWIAWPLCPLPSTPSTPSRTCPSSRRSLRRPPPPAPPPRPAARGRAFAGSPRLPPPPLPPLGLLPGKVFLPRRERLVLLAS